jgi:hypothetical protein
MVRFKERTVVVGKECGGDGRRPFKQRGGAVEEGGRAVGGDHAAGRSWGRAWGTSAAADTSPEPTCMGGRHSVTQDS